MSEIMGTVETNLDSTIIENKNISAQRVKRYVTFGPYIIGSTLGEGEFGKVKLGWTKTSNSNEIPKQVAIKLIKKDNLKDNPEKEMKIYREINALKYLNHPNIIKLEEILQNSKYIGIVLEYASGGEFYKYIQRKRRLKENVACKLFSQLISGVSYMHYKGLVHRDLKLENLLLDKNENLIITDFGFVNEFSLQNRLMKTSCGSPCYAAPELVLSTQPYEGTKADTWSCGVILFAMLAGYLPWDDDPANPNGDDIARLYYYITSTPLKFPDYINPLARDLLRKILISDPRKRYVIERIRIHEWLAPYHDFLNISSYDWDVASKLGSTAFISSRNSTADRRQKVRPYSMISNINNQTPSKSNWESSKVSQLSASMHKLNISKEDDTADTIRPSNNQPFLNNTPSADMNTNQNFPSNDTKSKNIPSKLGHSKPRPTTLHITFEPSLEPATSDTNNITTNNLNSGNNRQYDRVFPKKTLNKHEPKNRAVMDTINEDKPDIDTHRQTRNLSLSVKGQNSKENNFTNIKRNSMEIKLNSTGNNPPKRQADRIETKVNSLSTSSLETDNERNHRVYMSNDSNSSFKASDESVHRAEKKRFSFLSIYSSYSSSKSSIHSGEHGRVASRQGRSPSTNLNHNVDVSHTRLHKQRNTSLHQTGMDSKNNSRYNTAPSNIKDKSDTSRNINTSNASSIVIDANHHTCTLNEINNKKVVNNSNKSNRTKKKKSERSSIMISSLKLDKKKVSQPVRQDTSTARKVIDFFKRKSTIL